MHRTKAVKNGCVETRVPQPIERSHIHDSNVKVPKYRIDYLYAARIPLHIDWFQTRILALGLPNIFCAQQLDLVMFYTKRNNS